MVMFDHHASFDTFAMDPMSKKKIVDDLDAFSKSGDHYAKIGKPWKQRGYLLYGPPGTGKSTMIACIANYLKYDIYDLDLTAVDSNAQLRQLLVSLPSRVVMVIEDVDCSLNESKATLSGLLNCVDGLWSTATSRGERIVVFTTNHIDEVDPALRRKGRMDVQVELGYCKFEAFKVLAKNCLGVVLDEHPLFERVEELLEEVEITPAEVAEELWLKRTATTTEECLGELIRKLEEIRDDGLENEEFRMLYNNSLYNYVEEF